MITDYTPGEFLTYEEYELVFDDGHNNGFAFPCDESGHLLSSATEAAVENYLWCMAHPDDFVRWNRILCHKRKYRENASGVCSCGKKSNYGMSTPELVNVRTVDNGIIFLGKNYCRLKRGSNKFAVLPPLSREKALQRLCAELGM